MLSFIKKAKNYPAEWYYAWLLHSKQVCNFRTLPYRLSTLLEQGSPAQDH